MTNARAQIAREFAWALAAAGLLELAKFVAPLLAEQLLVVGRFLVVG